MKIKYKLTASVAAFIFAQNVVAQQRFNEISYSPNETTFRLNAPSKPTLRLYEAGLGGKAYKKIKLTQNGDNTWTATVKGDLKGKFYTFDIGHGETPGVFAKAVGCNGGRGAVVDMKETNPTAGKAIVVYRLRVRQISLSMSCTTVTSLLILHRA